MKLLIMRHGAADSATRDFDRRLTRQGTEEVKRSAAGLLAHRSVPLRTFASPLVRARQTAELVLGELELDQSISTIDEISPAGCPDRVVARLSAEIEKELCLLVSHQPFVSIFVEYLTNRKVFMDTANVACISMDVLGQNCGDLEWFIPV